MFAGFAQAYERDLRVVGAPMRVHLLARSPEVLFPPKSTTVLVDRLLAAAARIVTVSFKTVPEK